MYKSSGEKMEGGGYMCISAYGIGSLHVLEGTNECWKVDKGFRATYAPLQMTCISAG